ncbi:MAG: BON domain-containing protein [Hydrogenophaga sp.]|jgi:hyperosmotically inducible protein|uniref:BON domain-containing protein n=1 Tax=Hydrogenophaga sp. TaxID=1904254 RepID=UPI001D673B28|nr:BON domain-containing protein [Hydrogenophaga sp.]MBW0169919.1 BON domain-containing protein [Hydrogenophaga sp.]MBW0183058.1 BON domain-containing protein [Hydrogenophaga sp.]
MRTSQPDRAIGALAVALALTALVACGKKETPMDAPPSPPPVAAPAEAPAAIPAPNAPATTTLGEKVDDTVITTKVKTALLADEAVKGTDISVTTVGGEVQLAGVVDNKMQADRAVELAKAVQGVQRVQDGMTVKK